MENFVPLRFLINNGAEVDVCFLDLEGDYTTILVELVALGNIGNFADDQKAARVGCIEYFLKKNTNVNFTGVSIILLLIFLLFIQCYLIHQTTVLT